MIIDFHFDKKIGGKMRLLILAKLITNLADLNLVRLIIKRLRPYIASNKLARCIICERTL